MYLTVENILEEGSKYLTIYLKKPKNFNFYPGQYIDIELSLNPVDPRNNVRAFTITSSPTEKHLMITFKKGISRYKKYLESIRVNDQIKVSHPAGTFILDDSTPAVFIAGGIGITPFRSMLKYAVDLNLKTPLNLIYTSSNPNFAFKAQLDNLQKTYSNLKLIYLTTTTERELNKINLKKILTQLKISSSQSANLIYYLSGSHKMVESVSKLLLDFGVDQFDIREDNFDGY